MLECHPKSLARSLRMTPVILTRLFVEIDDCMKEFEVEMKKQLIGDETIKRNRDTRLSISEIMTIIISFSGQIIIQYIDID